MNKKYLLILLVPAVIMPMLLTGILSDDMSRADEIGRQFAADNPGVTIHTTVTEEAITEQEEINRTELIIMGTVSKVESYWQFEHVDDDKPIIMTKYVVDVEDTLKGDSSDETVSIVVFGGELDGVKHVTPSTQLAMNDKVLLLLGKSTNSIFGNDHALVSVSKSIYVIEGTQATNVYDERSGTLDEVISRITGKIC